MEGRIVQLMDCMVIEQFYPRTGVDGVDEQPVYGKEVDEYRTALGASFDDEFIFKKVMKSRGKARTWFVPGDVICHRIGLTEDRCDLLRPMRDRVYSSSKVDVSIYEAEIEEARREAIEGHKWKVHRRKTLFVVIDPQGRALVVARQHWGDSFTILMEQLCPMLKIHQVYACKPYRVAASWCAFKAVHRYAMEHCDNKMSAVQFRKCIQYAEWIWWRRTEIKNMMGTGRIYKMYKRRSKKFMPFWDRCFRMMDDGIQVPDSVRHIREHPTTRWIAVTPQEAEWYLGCVYWPEWYGGDPVRFDKFIKCSRGRMWK